MGKGSAPKPPDPSRLAAQQSQTNLNTAIANNRMGMVDQIGPYGSLTYETIYDQPQAAPTSAPSASSGPRMRERYNEATGKYEMIPVGPTRQAAAEVPATTGTAIPRYRATTTLSPEQQRLLDLQTQAQGNFGQLAVDQSAKLGTLLGTPVNINNESTEARLWDLAMKRVAPEMDRRRESTRTTLSNQGIKEGSTAFDRAMERVMQGENDQFNQLALTGRSQAVSEALAERNQPINEITALMSGSQVSQPQFQNIPTSQMPTVDRAGLEMAQYGADSARYQQQQAGVQNIMGGLFGLGSGMLMGGVNPMDWFRRGAQ
jgi:hypothetical protein